MKYIFILLLLAACKKTHIVEEANSSQNSMAKLLQDAFPFVINCSGYETTLEWSRNDSFTGTIDLNVNTLFKESDNIWVHGGTGGNYIRYITTSDGPNLIIDCGDNSYENMMKIYEQKAKERLKNNTWEIVDSNTILHHIKPMK